MAEPPPESSYTPPDTPLSESARSHERSMEESEPNGTRKRPRLDSGSRATEGLSLEGAALTAPVPAAEMDITADLVGDSNDSKMTINTKSAVPETTDETTPPSPDLPDPSAQPETQQTDSTSTGYISISSSPAQSPEIEVAELEDMDQDPNTSSWRPLEEALREQLQTEVVNVEETDSLVDSFPRVRDRLSARESLTRISAMIERGDPNDAAALTAVKVWMDGCVANLSQLTPKSYSEDHGFWNALPMLVESLMRRRYELPVDDPDGPWTGLENVFMSFIKITLHLIRLDNLVLSLASGEQDTQAPDCLSRHYLSTLGYVIACNHTIPFFRALSNADFEKTRDLLVRLWERTITPPLDLANVLMRLTSALLELIPKFPNLTALLLQVIVLANCIVECQPELQELTDHSGSGTSCYSSELKVLYEMIWSINGTYQEWITKKLSWLSSETNEQLLGSITRSWTNFFMRDPEFVHRLARDIGLELPEESDLEEQSVITRWAWKLGILKRQIMEGRMEIRVQGVETMQSELVAVWTNRLSRDPNGPTSPLAQYLAQYIKNNKIVEYLVGVDSHPQMISRASNIIGILVVTSTYTDDITDTIWKTVTECQDSRIASEVLVMFVRTFYMHPSTSSAFLHACSKLMDFPLERFDAQIFDYCDSLLNKVAQTAANQDQSDSGKIWAIPLQFCVRLIRESTAAASLSVEQRKQLQIFGSQQLARFIKIGASEDNRMEIYERCIQDIAEMNQHAAGSIQVLSALIPSHDGQEMRKLATDFDLTRLVVNDLLHTISTIQHDTNSFAQHGLDSRVAMLFRLIHMAPESITPELGQSLWNEVFLSERLGTDGYQAIWDLMVKALNESFEQNVFLDRCIHEYLPGLKPEDYSHQLLAFAKQSINYEVRFNPPVAAGEDEVVTIPGMDRIWTFILTASPGTIEAEATQFAIEVYLDHQIIRTSPRSAVQATHVAIANRCIEQLKSAAASLQDSEHVTNEADAFNATVDPEELRFTRSLLFLHRLLHGLRARPQYRSPTGSPPRLPDLPLKGNPMDITWQSFDGPKSSCINHLRIGDLSTVTELVETLTHLTGFSKFTTICGGQKVDLNEEREALLKDTKVLQSGHLIIRKAPDAHELPRDDRRQSLTLVDIEVLKHFDELYDFLTLKEDIASEVYDFLIVFPPPERMLELVTSELNDEKVLFPVGKPRLAFYSFHVLLICLREEAAKEIPRKSFVNHSIKTLVAFLMDDRLAESLPPDEINLLLATTAVECLLSALAAYQPTDDAAMLSHDSTPLVKQLLSFIDMARSTSTKSSSGTRQKLISCSFGILMEGAMRDNEFWNAVKQEVRFDQLVCTLLLEDNHQTVRSEAAERIKMICAPTKSLKNPANGTGHEMQTDSPTVTPTRIDMLATIWDAFLQTIPRAPDCAQQSAEFFNVALWVFRSVAEKSPHDIVFSVYLRQWSDVMFSHQTEEFVGRQIVDELLLGLAQLLELCLDLADSANVLLDTFDLTERILGTYLFPDLSPETEEILSPRRPVMHNETRHRLYNIVTLLCKGSDNNLYQAMRQLENVVVRDNLDDVWICDRSKTIRAPEGYAGLRNLSNTCYLNSLMTQLFMNIEFRDFILNLDLKAPQTTQKLLSETQKLFAWMQDTWQRSVDPQDFVESIRTYDNDLIDITIQMDVDEFYNLLFDRWEAQVLDVEDKKKFRSFFGGQLVQQIKSKECAHISERLEPFSAIQCDIKGKASLEESLQAYVEGEVMQGDNKYSCTACGRHVDAVKRACLKDIPDNLIFHLKRFDFDMVTMLRSKINDRFEFPERIDMTPYNVKYLSEPDAPVEPDVFELVGVLIHTGTAESGHYYSYTRTRPTSGDTPSWVDFNDTEVTSFNTSMIADQCFGGPSESFQGIGSMQINKVWNAYMLFYQRVSKMEASKEIYKPLKPDYPVRLPVPLPIAHQIAIENELFIRTYSLLDPCYVWLVRLLLHRSTSTAPAFPQNTQLESLAVNVGLDTLEQVVTRLKDYTGLDDIASDIYTMVNNSPNAALRTLQWFYDRDTSMRNVIFRILSADARQKIITIVLKSIKVLLASIDDEYPDQQERDDAQHRLILTVQRIVDNLHDLWPALQTAPRVWEDYFDMLLGLAGCGPELTGMLLESGFLTKCLEITWLDTEDKMNLEGYYHNYIRMLEKGRRFSYRNMMSLCAFLLTNIDFALPYVADQADRSLSSEGKFALGMSESNLIEPLEEDGSLWILTKLLQHDNFGNRVAVRKIISAFLASEPQAGFLPHIFQAVDAGLRFMPADLCVPFLDAAIVFCQECPVEAQIVGMITSIAQEVKSTEHLAAREHLNFFNRLCTCANQRVMLTSDWFTAAVRDRIPDFIPTLLLHTTRSVRQDALELLGLLLCSYEDEEATEELRSQCGRVGREFVVSCAEILNTAFRSGTLRTDSRVIDEFVSTASHCLGTYFGDSPEDQRIVEQVTAILSNFQRVQVDVPDDLVSEAELHTPEDWEATSALASDSETGVAGSP